MAKSTDTTDVDEGGPDGLTFQQRKVIEWLAGGDTDRDAAKRENVDYRSISRWRCTNPVFAKAEQEAHDRVVLNVRRRAKALAARAMDTVIEVMDGYTEALNRDGDPVMVRADAQHRLRAADMVLSRAGVTEIKGVELTGKDGGPVRVQSPAVELSDAALAELAAGALPEDGGDE